MGGDPAISVSGCISSQSPSGVTPDQYVPGSTSDSDLYNLMTRLLSSDCPVQENDKAWPDFWVIM